MITIYCTLRNGAGDEIEHGQVSADNLRIAVAAADTWGSSRLVSCDDPDAYVEHIWSVSKKKPMTTAEFLDAVEPTLDW